MFQARRNTTKTIHPLNLEVLLDASQPVEILDIRPRAEFEKVSIEARIQFRRRNI